MLLYFNKAFCSFVYLPSWYRSITLRRRRQLVGSRAARPLRLDAPGRAIVVHATARMHSSLSDCVAWLVWACSGVRRTVIIERTYFLAPCRITCSSLHAIPRGRISGVFRLQQLVDFHGDEGWMMLGTAAGSCTPVDGGCHNAVCRHTHRRRLLRSGELIKTRWAGYGSRNQLNHRKKWFFGDFEQ